MSRQNRTLLDWSRMQEHIFAISLVAPTLDASTLTSNFYLQSNPAAMIQSNRKSNKLINIKNSKIEQIY